MRELETILSKRPRDETSKSQVNYPVLIGAPLTLVSFAVILLFMIGDIGFQGDDWWILARGYWHPFFSALSTYTADSSRPIEGIYWISIFKIFGFNRFAFQFFSLSLFVAGIILFALCVYKLFPEKPILAVISAFVVTALPTTASLTYILHTDNSRLAIVFFWLSVLLFQRWTEKSTSWVGLILPVFLYCLGSLTYETATLLIFSIPFFTSPIYLRQEAPKERPAQFFTRMAVGIFGGLAFFLAVRFIAFKGGAVSQSSIFPDPKLFWSYLYSFASYLMLPFIEPAHNPWSLLWGASLALSSIIIALNLLIHSKAVHPGKFESIYLLFLGLIVFALGSLPYMLAGYSAEIGLTSQSRVFSSASFGFALIAAALVSAPQSRIVKGGVIVVVGLLIGVWGSFYAEMRLNWQLAAKIRDNCCCRMLAAVPNVKDGTVFLLFKGQSYIPQKAAIFHGVDGTSDFIKMLYNNRSVDAYFLYPEAVARRHEEGREAIVTKAGIKPRGRIGTPAPLDNMVILERWSDSDLGPFGATWQVMPSLTKNSAIAAIKWKGVDQISTNQNLILQTYEGDNPVRDLCSCREN